MEQKVEPNAFTMCIRAIDILDFEIIRNDSPSRGNWYHSDDESIIHQRQYNLTVKDIFKYSPATDNIFKAIYLRNFSTYDIMHLKTQNMINDKFAVDKFLYSEYVCYRTRPKHVSKKNSITVAENPSDSGLIYKVIMGSSLHRSHHIMFGLHLAHTYPYRSIPLFPVMHRHFNASQNKSTYNDFKVSESQLTVNYLPSPYETNCIDYWKNVDGMTQNKYSCVHFCVRRITMERYGKMPFTSFIFNEYDRRIISYLDVKFDKSLGRDLLEIQRYCKNMKCSKNSCVTRLIISKATWKRGNVFTLKYSLSDEASVLIDFFPKMTLLYLITYLLSILSSWTGVYVLQLNPVNALKKILKFKQKIEETIKRKERRERRLQKRIERQNKQLLKPKWILVGQAKK